MAEYKTISKTNPKFPQYLNFQTLRDLGINRLQELSGKIWTDYNLHDPGVTILEVLCYAITDLGYRNNFDIEDLLALKPGDADAREQENNFFTPDQILTCNPLTDLDWRKRLIDIDGVRNAWLEKVETYEPAISINWAKSRLQYDLSPDQSNPENRFNPRGLYRVWVDLDPTFRKDPCGQLYRSRSPVLEEVNRVLCSYRNLCEDIHEIVVLEDEEIALCADLELAPDADPEDVLVEVYVQVQAFLLPRIQFYTLQALLNKGKSITEIFDGRPSAIPAHDTQFDGWPTDSADNRLPYSHGFIDVDELQALTPPKVLHTSDLYRVIMQVPGVAAVRKFSISNYINGLRQSKGESWSLSLTSGYRPILGIDYSQITLYKGDLPLPFDQDEVKRRYFEQQAAAIKTPRDAYELDLSVPRGKYYATLADHYSIQHDFPLTYGISEDGLPETVSALRKAQARQLKGYLVFFDQLLANYLAQLSHIRDLFSWEVDQGTESHGGSDTRSPDRQHTYFTQALDFPAWTDILTDVQYLDAIAEDNITYRERRNRFLDHLLARFAETFSEYALLNYQLQQNGQDKAEIVTNLIEDKAHFLQNYPVLGRDRFRAFNYGTGDVWDTDNVSGFKRRVARLLGINDVRRHSLSHYHLDYFSELWTWAIRETDDQGEEVLWLESLSTYCTEDEARTDLNSYLACAQSADCYIPLTYYYAYHFGWDVVDRQGEVLVRCDRTFPSQLQRIEFLDALAANVADRLPDFPQTADTASEVAEDMPPSVSPEDFFTIQGPDNEGQFCFRIVLPATDDKEELSFTGIQRYNSSDNAQAAAVDSLTQIQIRQNYRPRILHHNEDMEDQAAARFMYYSFVVVDGEGTRLAQSPKCYSTTTQRAQAIGDLIAFMSEEPINPEDYLESKTPAYIGRLEDTTGKILLNKRYSDDSRLAAWQQSDQLMELAQDRDNFQMIESSQGFYGWELTTETKNQVLALHYYASAQQRDESLVDLDTYLQKIYLEAEGFHILEHILLRPRQAPPVGRCDFEPVAIDDIPEVLLTEDSSVPLDADLTLQDGEDGNFSFVVRDGECQILFTSSEFPTEAKRWEAMEIMIQNDPQADGYVLGDDKGYFFSFPDNPDNPILPDNPDKLLGKSRYFGDAASRDTHLDWLKTNLSRLGAKFGFTPAGDPITTYALHLPSTSSHPSFEFFEFEGSYYFHVNDSQGNVLFHSQKYDSFDERESELKKVVQAAGQETNYAVRKVLGSDRIFYYFVLYARDSSESSRSQETQTELGRSRYFELLWELENCRYWFQNQVAVPASDHFLPICVEPSDVETLIKDTGHLTWQDPYSFWATVILPYWPHRFHNKNRMDFRRFVERTLRLEAPAHVALRIAWVGPGQMGSFEKAYRHWLEQLALATQGLACDLAGSLNQLLDILTQLRSIYPEANLYDPTADNTSTTPMVLNQTALGTAED
jgi:hypothetical protein